MFNFSLLRSTILYLRRNCWFLQDSFVLRFGTRCNLQFSLLCKILFRLYDNLFDNRLNNITAYHNLTILRRPVGRKECRLAIRLDGKHKIIVRCIYREAKIFGQTPLSRRSIVLRLENIVTSDAIMAFRCEIQGSVRR